VYRFNVSDFKWFDRTPASPNHMQWHFSNLLYNSVSSRAKVESVNPETGEYRIILTGTLDNEPFWFTPQP